tara:strand:+ start:226 stop:1002 length:777 start_codon:yes stop_codon:yes gene_type:complete
MEPKMDYKIKGKRALVIGASKGLGAASAKLLAEEGVEVFAAARNIDKINDWAKGLSVSSYQLDLTNSKSVSDLEKIILEEGFDILVNNCGGPPAGSARDQSSESWQSAFNSMALPMYQFTNAAIPKMIEKKWGRIISIGSSGIEQPIPNLVLSNGVRGAIAGWSKTLAAEVAQYGITVNMVLPGRISTDRLRELDEGKANRTGLSYKQVVSDAFNTIPAKRYGEPDEFAAVVTFLASELASYVTGSMIRVDGGVTMGL